MWTDSLKHFHFWCQKTLPLVYDDSLSYYEVLAKLTKHLNELTTLVNEIGDELERYEGVTDNRLDTLETWRTEVDTWRAQIDEWKTIVENWREDVDQWREDIDLWKTSINNWKDTVDNILEIIDDRLDTAEDDIDALEGRMDTAEDDISALQSDVTSLDSRLDDAESDIDSLEGRMDTAEDNITSLSGRVDDTEDIDLLLQSNAFYTIQGSAYYDTTDNKWYLRIHKPLNDAMIQYLLNGLSSNITSVFNGSWSPEIMYIIRGITNDFDYSDIYLQYYNGSEYVQLEKNNTPVVMPLVQAYATRVPSKIVIVLSTNNGSWYGLLDEDEFRLPYPSSIDSNKILKVNSAHNGYELISSTSILCQYATFEQIVGTWTDGSIIYQRTYDLGQDVIINNTAWTTTYIPIGSIDKIISVECMSADGVFWGDISATAKVSQNIELLSARNADTEAVRYFTIRYTKTSTP